MWQGAGEAMGRVEGKSPKGLVVRFPATRGERLSLIPGTRLPDNDKVVDSPYRAGIHPRDSTERRGHFIATLRAHPTAENYRGSLGGNYAFGENNE